MPTTANDLNISQAGYVTFDGTATFNGRTFQAGPGISLTNPDGIAGNTTIALTGGSNAIERIDVQTGIIPVVPSGGTVTFNGATVAAGTHPVRTDGINANTLALEVQISQAIAATDATKIGLSNFNSAMFSVDANGFVSAIGPGAFKWTDTSGTVTAAAFNGYFITGACTSTLPASPLEGDTISYAVDTASSLVITAAGSQKIRIGSVLSTAGGTATNNSIGDTITLVYRTVGTTWFAIPAPQGTWTVST